MWLFSLGIFFVCWFVCLLYRHKTFCDALEEALKIHQSAFQALCQFISLIQTFEESFCKDMAKTASSVFVWGNTKLFHVCVTHAQRPFFIFPLAEVTYRGKRRFACLTYKGSRLWWVKPRLSVREACPVRQSCQAISLRTASSHGWFMFPTSSPPQRQRLLPNASTPPLCCFQWRRHHCCAISISPLPGAIKRASTAGFWLPRRFVYIVPGKLVSCV